MRSAWFVTAAASAALCMSVPADLAAQGRSGEARPSQQVRQSEQDRRAAERDRSRAAREAADQRDARNADARRDSRENSDIRGADQRQAVQRQQQADRERQQQAERHHQQQAERQHQQQAERQRQQQIERQRQAERERTLRERQRQAERDHLNAERQRQADLERRRQLERDRGRSHDPWGYQTRSSASNGPPFCRSGAGHPVHGRQWCREKGFGLGYDHWERDGWGRLTMRQPRNHQQQLGRNLLIDMLGSATFRRFESYGSNYGRGAVSGYWVNDWGANVLELHIGGIPFARLVDSNRDGRVDRVLLRS
ncbi:hypothetical protein BH23GEM9_BH23GEM9_15500 [soil metagenome]